MKVVPFPGSLSTERKPECSPTMVWLILRPKPNPSDFVVKNGLKIRF